MKASTLPKLPPLYPHIILQHVPTSFLNLAASALMVLVKCWHLEQTFIASNLNVFTVKCINKEQNNKSKPKVNLAAGQLLLVTLP